MISIITTIHNGLAMNRLFLEKIQKYTFHHYELIVIDNQSSDGSAELFASQGAKIIRNKGNYSYPVCQNQGIQAAKYDVLVFINNDVIVSPAWDKRLLDAANANGLEIISPVGIEKLETTELTRVIRRKWLRIKNRLSLFGMTYANLKLMHRLMYSDWDKFCNYRFNKFGSQTKEGIVGNTVMMKRSAIGKVGLWDERIQAADFDLYIRTKKRHIEQDDIQPVHVALGVFIHHYIRLTSKARPTPFTDQQNMIELESKWDEESMKFYCKGFVGKYETESPS
jgi:GT2 family glycosyltransferase